MEIVVNNDILGQLTEASWQWLSNGYLTNMVDSGLYSEISRQKGFMVKS